MENPLLPQTPKIARLYIKKEERDEVDFLCVVKHQTILQVDIIKARPTQITQNNKFAKYLNFF